jgi:hypothetical protein
MALTKTRNRMIDGAYVSVKDFGATGDGTTDDTVAIQAALDSLTTGGVIYFPQGTYRVAKNTGTNDSWGIKVTNSNITLLGDQATLRRYDTDISTYALAYPILFVGTPDSNSASATENFVCEGITFQGENTRHSIIGDTPPDLRNSIEFKNTKNTLVKNCTFTKIDSSAIFFQYPNSYDYAKSAYYNLTKNYNSKITDSSFIAESHSTVNRALLHAINVTGVDFLNVSNNYFEWCDDCVNGATTYNRYDDTEDDTYTTTLGATKRTGRDCVISNNVVYNSSEHAFYMTNMDTVISGNSIRSDDPSICLNDIKIRGRNISVTGNTLSNGSHGISVTEAARDVSIIGNTINAVRSATDQSGLIDVSSDNLSTFLSNRSDWTAIGGSVDYQPMSNIVIANNTVTQQTSAAPNTETHIAVRVYTAISDSNYPEGQIQNLRISGNTFNNHNVGIYVFNDLVKNFTIDNNLFYAKPFTTSGFSSSTTLNTRAVMQARQSGSGGTLTSMYNATFTNNYVYGSTYLFSTHNASGTALSYFIPVQISGNRLDYIKNIKTADVRTLEVRSNFSINTGNYFLDRSLPSDGAMNNSLGDGSSSNSLKKFTFEYTGSDLIFYTDDSGTTITL